MFIFHDLYFNSIDDVDEHVGDFDAFSPGHSQYFPFSFDNGLATRTYPFSLDRFSTYIFFYSVHVLTLVIEAYD